jgi:guanylate kinase
MAPQGNLIIVSGPSGSGKSAISWAVLRSVAKLRFSISYTTRPPRGSERDGVEYRFLSRDAFEKLVSNHELLEWAEVYGNLYGTSRRVVEEILARGEDVLLDIDVQGAQAVRKQRPEAIAVFIMPPSFEVLRRRLEDRRLDRDYVIEQRLMTARREIAQYNNYDFLIVNEDLNRAAEELSAIVVGSRCRMTARTATAESIVATFGGTDAEDP